MQVGSSDDFTVARGSDGGPAWGICDGCGSAVHGEAQDGNTPSW